MTFACDNCLDLRSQTGLQWVGLLWILLAGTALVGVILIVRSAMRPHRSLYRAGALALIVALILLPLAPLVLGTELIYIANLKPYPARSAGRFDKADSGGRPRPRRGPNAR